MYINSITQIRQILPKSLRTQQPTLFSTYYIVLIQKKYANQIVKLIKSNHIHNQTQYLKAIKPNRHQQTIQLLLCKKNEIQKYQNLTKLIGQRILSIYQKQIPEDPPLTKQQYDIWSKYWPCTYKQTDFIFIYHKPEQINLIQKILPNPKQIILFNDQYQVLYRIQGGCPDNSINHGIIRLAQQWPLSYKYNEENIISEKPNMEQLQQSCIQKYYYFTGLNIMVNRTVCQMCAMALIHSRISRMYYLQQGDEDISDIFYNKRLNHRFALFKIDISK